MIDKDDLLEDIRDYHAQRERCTLPCACLRNPQNNDCGSRAIEVMKFIHEHSPFTAAK